MWVVEFSIFSISHVIKKIFWYGTVCILGLMYIWKIGAINIIGTYSRYLNQNYIIYCSRRSFMVICPNICCQEVVILPSLPQRSNLFLLWQKLISQKIAIFNGILLQKLCWPTVRKRCSSDQEKLLKFAAEGREFATFLRSLEQFIQKVKGQNNFW